MKNIYVKFFLASLILLFVNCDRKSSVQDCDSKDTTDIQHILTDTLNTYLKNNYWYVTDENGCITCRPFIYVCFQHLDKKKFVSFALSPHILIDTSLFFEVSYYKIKKNNDNLLFCILFDKKDSINTTFINNNPLVPVDYSTLNKSCHYDGRIFLKSYEITYKQGGGDTLLLLAQPLTTWCCNPPEMFF